MQQHATTLQVLMPIPAILLVLAYHTAHVQLLTQVPRRINPAAVKERVIVAFARVLLGRIIVIILLILPILLVIVVLVAKVVLREERIYRMPVPIRCALVQLDMRDVEAVMRGTHVVQILLEELLIVVVVGTCAESQILERQLSVLLVHVLVLLAIVAVALRNRLDAPTILIQTQPSVGILVQLVLVLHRDAVAELVKMLPATAAIVEYVEPHAILLQPNALQHPVNAR